MPLMLLIESQYSEKATQNGTEIIENENICCETFEIGIHNTTFW